MRAGALVAALAAAGCSGPSSSVPTGFGQECSRGPQIGGEAEMGVTDQGFHTDIDATITMAARTDGGCVGASVRPGDR